MDLFGLPHAKLIKIDFLSVVFIMVFEAVHLGFSWGPGDDGVLPQNSPRSWGFAPEPPSEAFWGLLNFGSETISGAFWGFARASWGVLGFCPGCPIWGFLGINQLSIKSQLII